MIEGLVAIIRTNAEVDILGACRALHAGGIRNMEITLNTPGALPAIHAAREAFGDEALVGAGTVLRPEEATAAIESGAQFIVTPVLQLEVVALCRERHIPVMCGAMTPTEIWAAYEAGADFVKLFPAGGLGLEYIKAVLGPLPFVRLVPTGGVTLENIAALLKVCPAVGVGSNLADAVLMREGDWDALRERARRFSEAALSQV